LWLSVLEWVVMSVFKVGGAEMNGSDVVVDEAVIYPCGDGVTGQERVAMNPG
jgi:hypothetical protein